MNPAEIVPQVYAELRRMAEAKLAWERPGHLLNATALVHEAFLKLGGERSFATPGDYYRAAAEAMRRILVDHARQCKAQKRGGGQLAQSFADDVAAPQADSQVEFLDEALTRLAQDQPRVAELVQLRYFGGFTNAEAAAFLGISSRTADGWWAYARGWLAAELGPK